MLISGVEHNYSMRITVFTPTYNRAHILSNLYVSLKQQTFKDFEWVVVDDGSSDNTESIIQQFVQEKILDISYYKQVNGGKHRAVNHGLQVARGDLFFIVDSDDQLPPDSLQQVDYYYSTIEGDPSFAGVCGMKAHFDGRIVGAEYPFEILDSNSLDFVHKYKHYGDKAEVIRTEVFRQFPFPDYPGEKYCAESLVWNRIARQYKMRYFKRTIYLCEYLPDGLSQAFVKNKRKSPTYATQICSELLTSDVPFKVKIKNAISFWRYAPCLKTNNRPHIPFWALILAPVGYAVYLHDSASVK